MGLFNALRVEMGLDNFPAGSYNEYERKVRRCLSFLITSSIGGHTYQINVNEYGIMALHYLISKAVNEDNYENSCKVELENVKLFVEKIGTRFREEVKHENPYAMRFYTTSEYKDVYRYFHDFERHEPAVGVPISRQEKYINGAIFNQSTANEIYPKFKKLWDNM